MVTFVGVAYRLCLRVAPVRHEIVERCAQRCRANLRHPGTTDLGDDRQDDTNSIKTTGLVLGLAGFGIAVEYDRESRYLMCIPARKLKRMNGSIEAAAELQDCT